MMVIYNELVSKGVFKPAKVNTANSRIRNILANKAYTGDYSDNDTKQAIKYPRIITDELFEAAQVKLQHNREAYKTTSKNVYYGKSLCRCNGYLMVAYRNNAVYRDNVTKRGISINAVDTVIWNETCEIYADEQHITDESNKEEWLRQIDENEIKLGNINEILTKNKKQEERLIDLYVDGRINDEQFNSRVGDIKKDNEKWQNEVAKIYSQNQKLEMLLNDEINRVAPSKINSVESDLERKEIINQVIKEVLIEQKENGIWTIRVIAKNDILQNSREQSGEYYYYYNKGNKKHLVFVDSNENETDVEIVTRFKQL
jgi:site-specific DNA recombinase